MGRGPPLCVAVVVVAEVVAMRTALAWMLLCSAALAQRVEPGVPPGWTVYVVHAPWCAPCQRFRRDYDTIAQFRGPLESAFSVKSCEWERPSEQRFARRFGVSSLPGFIVFRDGIHQQSFCGYSGDWKAFLERLNLDVDGAGEPREESGTPPKLARPITPEDRELPRISAMESEILRLRKLIENATKAPPESGSGKVPEGAVRHTPETDTVPGALPDTKPVARLGSQAGSSPLPPVLSIPAVEAPAGGGQQSAMPDIGGKWWSVLTTVGKIGLTTLAPEVALPASAALTAAGYVFGQVKKRRGEAAKAEFFRANRTPARDVSEVEQVLSLRQQESRDPLSDAMFGVLFEDISREDPNQTVGQAWTAAQQRFNRLAPLSAKSATITSSVKEA